MPVPYHRQGESKMYLHEITTGQKLEGRYQVKGTEYLVGLDMFGKLAVYRPNVQGVCRAETAELYRRFYGEPLTAHTAQDIASWLQDVWAKRVALALTLGERP